MRSNAPAARRIDEYQDSISDPSVKAGPDVSGYWFIGLCLFPLVGIGILGAVLLNVTKIMTP